MFYYNAMFALPLIGFILLRIIMGDKTSALLTSITVFFTHWGKQFLYTLSFFRAINLLLMALADLLVPRYWFLFKQRYLRLL